MLKLRPHIAQHAKPDLLTLLRSVNTIADIWRGEPYLGTFIFLITTSSVRRGINGKRALAKLEMVDLRSA
jgi:hypothetical protein